MGKRQIETEGEVHEGAGRVPARQRARRPRYIRWVGFHFHVAHPRPTAGPGALGTRSRDGTFPDGAAGTGVNCKTRALQAAVIPAKARIHSANLLKCVIFGLDSRFRGNDRCFGRGPIPNDANTPPQVYTQTYV
jgi:hypothetical protein